MTKQQIIEKIYEVMANKELTIGCRGIDLDFEDEEFTIIPTSDFSLKIGETSIYYDYGENDTFIFGEGQKIIGHPVMYGDACDWIEKPGNIIAGDGEIPWIVIVGVLETLVELWKFKRLPVDDQPDDCIQYLYSLIPE